MRVLILETQHEGHRLQYVRMIVDAIASLSDEVILATSASAAGSEELKTHLGNRTEHIVIDDAYPSADLSQSRLVAKLRFETLRTAIARHRPDHVYIPYGDGLAQVSGTRRLRGKSLARHDMEIEAILMRGRFAYPRAHWRDVLFARAWLAATSLAPFDVLHFLDPIPFEHIMQRGGALARKSRLIPEPVEPVALVDRQEARRRLNVPIDGRIICCPGALDSRKGIDNAIRAFTASTLHRDDRLLLAGSMQPDIRHVFDEAHARQPDRVLAIDRCLSDEELHLSISAADVVAAPYPRHVGSSGIVVRAAALQRMVLGSDYGWVGMVISRFGLGNTCDCTSVTALSAAMRQSLDDSAGFLPTDASRRFSSFHTQSNFEAHIANRLSRRYGHTPTMAMSTWDDVCNPDGA